MNFPKPIIATMNGPAFGSGVTQAFLCDSCVAVEDTKFSLPFSRWKVSPEGCSSVHLVRLAGPEVAKRMIIDGWIPTCAVLSESGTVGVFTSASAVTNTTTKAQH